MKTDIKVLSAVARTFASVAEQQTNKATKLRKNFPATHDYLASLKHLNAKPHAGSPAGEGLANILHLLTAPTRAAVTMAAPVVLPVKVASDLGSLAAREANRRPVATAVAAGATLTGGALYLAAQYGFGPAPQLTSETKSENAAVRDDA